MTPQTENERLRKALEQIQGNDPEANRQHADEIANAALAVPAATAKEAKAPEGYWHFVYNHNSGALLAAFPERNLAEAYSENCDWVIRELAFIGPAAATEERVETLSGAALVEVFRQDAIDDMNRVAEELSGEPEIARLRARLQSLEQMEKDYEKVCGSNHSLEHELAVLRHENEHLENLLFAADERVQSLANAAEMFLAQYATKPQPHGGIGEDQIDGDKMAFHARRLLARPLAAYRAQPVAAQPEQT